jgi:hypothetical protein
MGWLRDYSVQQLQELLQTYFGAMRHYYYYAMLLTRAS